jgi:hypothetical protein
MQLRLVRQYATDQRRVHSISFTSPQTITIVRQEIGGNPPQQVSQVGLPPDIEFRRESGLPPSPDQLNPSGAVDFNGSTTVSFNPDGTAVSSPDVLFSSRAVTLFGSTGRIKGFYLRRVNGTWEWQ